MLAFVHTIVKATQLSTQEWLKFLPSDYDTHLNCLPMPMVGDLLVSLVISVWSFLHYRPTPSSPIKSCSHDINENLPESDDKHPII